MNTDTLHTESTFLYDQTFQGLLTCVFYAYKQKRHPTQLLFHNAILPLFTDHITTIHTNPDHAHRVWRYIRQKISAKAANNLYCAYLSDEPHTTQLIYNVIRKIVDAPILSTLKTSSTSLNAHGIETDLTDTDILNLYKLAQKVRKSALHIIQFVRFQKTRDGIFFSPINPIYNALPLALNHFQDRFADQTWIIYDITRNYGYHYTPPLQTAQADLTEITLDHTHLQTIFTHGQLKSDLLATDELHLQAAWAKYFQAITIKERINPKLHRQHMPARYWQYLPEKYLQPKKA